jgi:ADP-ribose pyrophosphatase YjhB (NUDIX family)
MKIGCVSLVAKELNKIVVLECAKGRGLVLPGGKWERETGESFKEGAARELVEETGLIAINQQLIFAGFNVDDYYGYTFLTQVENFKWKNTPEGKPRFATWDELLNKTKSKFMPYYELLADAFRATMNQNQMIQVIGVLAQDQGLIL